MCEFTYVCDYTYTFTIGDGCHFVDFSTSTKACPYFHKHQNVSFKKSYKIAEMSHRVLISICVVIFVVVKVETMVMWLTQQPGMLLRLTETGLRHIDI